jgi:glutamine amidotransferase
MCIIIMTLNGRIPSEELEVSLQANRHGWGFCYPAGDGRLCTRRGLSVSAFWSAWGGTADERDGRPTVFHARIATHGMIRVDNCHPFRLHRRHGHLAVAHNGIIPGMGSRWESDTRALARLLGGLPVGFLDNRATRRLIRGVIGASKLVFLSGCGRHWVVNESEYGGHWSGGRWYSNRSYKPIVCTLPVKPASIVTGAATTLPPAVPASLPTTVRQAAEWVRNLRERGRLKDVDPAESGFFP